MARLILLTGQSPLILHSRFNSGICGLIQMMEDVSKKSHSLEMFIKPVYLAKKEISHFQFKSVYLTIINVSNK